MIGGEKMNLTPRDNFLRNAFDDLLDMPMGRNGDMMKTDVFEQGDNYIIEADMPGMKKENINIGYENEYLNITANKESNEAEENKNYVRRERLNSQYRRSFYVGQIDESQVKAHFENGILKVVVPRKQLPNANQKPISIE
jgi:HSP20 family protein